MKKLLTAISLILLFSATAFGAVEIVDPSNRTMYVDEGFECPYRLGISDQEGYPFTATEMATITKIRIYFDDEHKDSDSCPDCFDWTTYADNSQIVVDLGDVDFPDGTGTATLFIWDSTYTSGRRIGTFSMTASDDLASASQSADSGIDASFINLVTTAFDNNLSDADDTVQKAIETLDDLIGGGSGTITSVNSDTGPEVVLNADDIDDTATTNKWVTQVLIDAWNSLVTFPGWADADDLDATGAINTGAVQDNEIDYTAVTLNDFTFDVGTVTKEEFGYLSGVTSSIQDQIDGLGSGDVTGPESSTYGNIPVFGDASGKVIIDSYENMSDLHPAANLGPEFTGIFNYINPGQTMYMSDQLANTFFAGGSSGIGAKPTFREIVDADIPDDITITETDPDFATWLSSFDPFETSDETDPVYSAWLIATPPLYPGGWYDALQGSVNISGFNNDAGYLTAEVDGSTTNEIQTIDVSQLSGTTLQLSLSDDGEATKEIDLSSLQDGTGTDDQTASEVTYSNTSSGLTATDTQAAIDEVEARVDTNDAKVSYTGDSDTSATNEINTITGDDSNSTTGLGITIAGGGDVSTSVSGDTVTITCNDTDTTYSASDFNHDDLSNITGTAGQYNHPTDAQMTVLGNTSNTNTGDETSASIEDIMTGADAVTTPADADTWTTVVSGVLKKVTWANIKATLKTYFDTVYVAIADIADYYGKTPSGATVPTSPSTGDKFIHTPTGRTVELMWDGIIWQPVKQYGDAIYYVDGTDGTDTINNGGTADSGAFATIQYAVDLASVTKTPGNSATINVAAGTYAENVTVNGSDITINGSRTILDSGLICDAGCLQGTHSSTQLQYAKLIRDSGTWTVSPHQRYAKWVHVTSGAAHSGDIDIDSKLIDGANSTATAVRPLGLFSNGAPTTGDTFNIEEPGVTVTKIIISGKSTGIIVNDVEFSMATGIHLDMFGQASSALFNRCDFNFSTYSSIWINQNCYANFHSCLFTGVRLFVRAAASSEIGGCLFDGTNVSGFVLLQSDEGGTPKIGNGTIIDNASLIGIRGFFSYTNFACSLPGGGFRNTIRNCTTGVSAELNAVMVNMTPSYVIFGDSIMPGPSHISSGTGANKLIDTSVDFTTIGVSVGDRVVNISDDTTALVTAVDSATQLSLDTDIMIASKHYWITASDSLNTTDSTTSTGGQL